MFRGLTKGAFVTTSTFTSGAPRAVEGFDARGMSIELYDSTRFFEALSIGRRESYSSYEELFLYTNVPMDRLRVIDESPL